MRWVTTQPSVPVKTVPGSTPWSSQQRCGVPLLQIAGAGGRCVPGVPWRTLALWLIGGLCGLEDLYVFPYIGKKKPNWRTHIFQRGWNHQPDGIGITTLWDLTDGKLNLMNHDQLFGDHQVNGIEQSTIRISPMKNGYVSENDGFKPVKFAVLIVGGFPKWNKARPSRPETCGWKLVDQGLSMASLVLMCTIIFLCMYRLHVGLLTCWLYCYENGWWHIGPKPWIAPSATLVWVKALWTPTKWDGGLLQKQSMRRSTRAPRIVLWEYLQGTLGFLSCGPVNVSGWWFGSFSNFPYIGDNNPNCLIFFRGVETLGMLLSIISPRWFWSFRSPFLAC